MVHDALVLLPGTELRRIARPSSPVETVDSGDKTGLAHSRCWRASRIAITFLLVVVANLLREGGYASRGRGKSESSFAEDGLGSAL